MTKEELKAALVICRRLTRLQSRLNDIEATGGIRTSMQSSGGKGGKRSDASMLAAELTGQITELRKKLEIEQAIIRRALEKVEFDELERRLMVMRYVDCRPWRYIQIVLGYADRQPYRIHSEAVSKAIDDT